MGVTNFDIVQADEFRVKVNNEVVSVVDLIDNSVLLSLLTEADESWEV